MKITPHFTTEEMGDPPDRYQPAVTIVCKALEVIRADVGRPIRITSGWRSAEHNARIGGVPNSDHLRGLAADIAVEGYSPVRLSEVAALALQRAGVPWDQIIWYPRDGHVHIGMGHRMRGQLFKEL